MWPLFKGSYYIIKDVLFNQVTYFISYKYRVLNGRDQ